LSPSLQAQADKNMNTSTHTHNTEHAHNFALFRGKTTVGRLTHLHLSIVLSVPHSLLLGIFERGLCADISCMKHFMVQLSFCYSTGQHGTLKWQIEKLMVLQGPVEIV
jgi:hypothetical protein